MVLGFISCFILKVHSHHVSCFVLLPVCVFSRLCFISSLASCGFSSCFLFQLTGRLCLVFLLSVFLPVFPTLLQFILSSPLFLDFSLSLLPQSCLVKLTFGFFSLPSWCPAFGLSDHYLIQNNHPITLYGLQTSCFLVLPPNE